LVDAISDASREQAQGIDQINKAVNQMDGVIQKNAGNAQESASSAKELSSQAATLAGIVVDLQQLVYGSDVILQTSRWDQLDYGQTVTQPVKSANPTRRTGNFGPVSKPVRQTQPESMDSRESPKPKDLIPFDDDLENF